MSTTVTPPASLDALTQFQWTPQPEAERFVHDATAHALGSLPWATAFSDRLYRETGNRFTDLIDTIVIGGEARVREAVAAGWVAGDEQSRWQFYENPKGLFPTLAVGRELPAGRVGIALKVERVEDFLTANELSRDVVGAEWKPYRSAMIEQHGPAAFSVAERHGWRGFYTDAGPAAKDVARVYESFRNRPRDLETDEAAFAECERLIDDAVATIGRDYACDRFFAAERDYWTARNRAARAQKARQDRLGLGWANHDHHTYRSGRAFFAPLVRLWEKLGLVCRERFYAGKDAGWGAQVMEQPVTRVITFNDVDLSPEELIGDFSHDGLAPRDALGTIGLWCGLHGEAVLQAGMHHLECMFDFEALRDQLAAEHDIRTMKPFTDFAHLRQAFTEGERWSVDPERIERLLAAGKITPAQAAKFTAEGAIGSHLENLERNGGFKGFNQHGVSEIINATDPRRQAQKDAFETVTYATAR